MSVRPAGFRANGTVDIWDDENGHGGTVPLASLPFATNIDGTDNEAYLLMPCPICPALSIHPASGGAAPAMVQALHLLKQVRSKGRTLAQAKAIIRAHADRLDGPGRFRLARVTRADLEAGGELDPAVLD